MNRIKLLFPCLTFFAFLGSLSAQNAENISLQYDVSGYSTENQYENRIATQVNSTSNDTIPTINSEMHINDAGALTYMLPIDILKGQNNFQPNIALGYNSQSGNGQAGFGWNIVGLSIINRGGKSLTVDGITIGPQFDESDPFYLDGQRLISMSTTQYETEKYSKIKITRDLSATSTTGYSFIVQYTDGKVAYYRELSFGQHYIVMLKDSFNNEVHYSYSVLDNVPKIDMVSYGGTNVVNDKFRISFIYNDRVTKTKTYRNGVFYINSKILTEIRVSSTYLTANGGLYRKYKLFFDNIQGNTVERVIRIELENENGHNLRPLKFRYNNTQVGIVENNNTIGMGLPTNALKLGSVAVGDFYRSGKPTSVYEVKKLGMYDVPTFVSVGANGVFGTYPRSKDYFTAKCLLGNKISDNDQLLTIDTEYRGFFNGIANGYTNGVVDRVSFQFNDLITGQSKSFSYDFPVGATTLPIYVNVGTYMYTDGVRNETGRDFIIGDFNNDGLTDIIIFEKSDLYRTQQKIYMIQAGKCQTCTNEIVQLSGAYLNQNAKIYQIEFDGDGVPELMVVDKDSGIYSLYKISLVNNTLTPIQNQQNIQLSNYINKTPLIFGDYNGDGLTDFITPQKVYAFEGSNPGAELQKMETEQLLWWEYISTGNGSTGFIKTQKDYTQQKLAYLGPSYRNIIKEGSFWEHFWAGEGADSYGHTEYGTSTILAMDFNNDGKTDLVSFRKFGTAVYDAQGRLNLTTVDNLNSFTYTPPPTWVSAVCTSNIYPYHSRNVISSWQCTPFELFTAGHWQHHFPVPVTTSTANKIFFHANVTNPDGTQQLVNLPNVIPLNNVKISSLSLVLNNSDYNQLNTYKSQIYISDCLVQDRLYTINNDNFNEGLIREVDNGSPVLQKIEYRPMVEKNNNNLEKAYSTTANYYTYPIFVHRNIGLNYLVYKMHTLFDNSILTKEYRYQNGVQGLNGKGFMGFERTFTSDVYESREISGTYVMKDIFKPIFWTIKTFNPTLENSLIISTYGSLNQTQPNSSDGQNPNSVFTKSVVSYQTFNKGNHRYLILPILESNYDFQKGITISKTYQYDTGGDLLLNQIYTDYNNQASSIEKYFYAPEFNNNDHYFFGKINRVESTSIRDAITFNTKTENSYNTDGTLQQTIKYGITAPSIPAAAAPIYTDYLYTPFGEVQSETVSTTGVATASGVASFTTSYEYDPTNRYLEKITSPDGLFSQKNINVKGWLLSEVSSLGLTTSYKYDWFGNVKEITDYLGKKTTITKMIDPSQPAGSYIIAKKREGGVETRILLDMFDREVKTMTQTINNQWVSVSKFYDVFGKKIQESEPYFDGDTPQMNYTEYDDLNRPIKQTLFTGKFITTCYEKMKVTVEEGNKKTSKWLDATGNTVRFKDSGGEITYKYYPNGSPKETNYDGIKTTITIDAWGNKKTLNDPSAGTYTYLYDNLSRIKKETNPNGGFTEYSYDDWGRLLTENTTSGSGENTTILKNYEYDGATHLPTTITGTYNGKTYNYTTHYNDVYHRITGKTEITPDFTYITQTTYDDLGRVDTTKLKTILSSPSYTTESNVKNNYDGNSILTSQTDLDNTMLIWEINNINSHGLTTQMTYGNGYVVSTQYNSGTLSLENIRHQKTGSNPIVDIDYTYNITQGVLTGRNNHVFGKNEEYQYDDLKRLLEEKTNGVIQQTYTYDKRGRMTSNTDVGKYNYNDQNYQLQSVNYNTNGNQLNTNRGFAQVQYNAFKNPNEIFLPTKDRISFDFSILETRSVSYYGSLNTDPLQRPKRKYYSADKAIEIERDLVTGKTKIITYITGDPYSANYMRIVELTGSSPTSDNRYFLHRDNQGSIIAITKADVSGTVVEKRYFDAWGNLKEAIVGGTPQTPNSLGWVNNLLIDRGYTGHEHLKTVGLIHMNGRLYDPQLRRFLSPDNYVQDSFNTQNYNRYGYVYNNPLLYTDPSGEIAFLAVVGIAMAVGIITNGINNMINGVPFWYGMGKSGTMGAISGAISFGIGAVANSAFGVLTSVNKALFQAAMHGITGGLMSEIQGGTFASGFAAGAVSSLVASGVESLGQNGGIGCDNGNDVALKNNFGSSGAYKVVMIASGGLSGGLSSTIAGGNFMDGFRQGVITSGLNHLGNEIGNAISYKNLTKEFNEQLKKTRTFFSERKQIFDEMFDRLIKQGASAAAVELGYEMYIQDFINLVRTGAEYDIKNKDSSLFSYKSLNSSNGKAYYNGTLFDAEDFGNYNFGVAAKAFGITLKFAQLGAGVYQILELNSSLNWYKTYFDEPRDYYKIREGYNHFK
jgi:RHS repeat-associated protein